MKKLILIICCFSGILSIIHCCERQHTFAIADQNQISEYDPSLYPISKEDLLSAIRSTKTTDAQREILALRSRRSTLVEESLDEYKRLVTDHPDNVGYVCGYVNTYYEALFGAYHPKNRNFYTQQGASKNQQLMRKVIIAAIQGNGKNRAYCWEAYGMKQYLGDPIKHALPAFQKAAKLNARNGRIYEWVARCYLDAKRPKDALKAAKKASLLTPNSIAGYYWQAVAYKKLKRYKEAFEAMKQSHAHIDPKVLSESQRKQLDNYRKLAEGQG